MDADAKRRHSLLKQEGPGEKRAEHSGKFKNADLYKMHTYHDALPLAKSVWILYPGTEAGFFGVDGQRCSSIDELPGMLDGVGALPMVPEQSMRSATSKVISRILP